MNVTEANAHFDCAEHQETLNRLCTPLGMVAFPELRRELLKRYGATPDDFCPFEENERIKDLLEAARRSLNQGLLAGSSPLELWWCNDDFFDHRSPNAPYAREQVANGPLLVVFDSVSAQNHSVLAKYNEVVAAHLSGPLALLWVPPYTGHTKRLRSLWSAILEAAPGLLARFRTWGDSIDEPQVLFDIGTVESLKAWSFGTLRTLGTQARSSNRRQQRLSPAPHGPLLPIL